MVGYEISRSFHVELSLAVFGNCFAYTFYVHLKDDLQHDIVAAQWV